MLCKCLHHVSAHNSNSPLCLQTQGRGAALTSASDDLVGRKWYSHDWLLQQRPVAPSASPSLCAAIGDMLLAKEWQDMTHNGYADKHTDSIEAGRHTTNGKGKGKLYGSVSDNHVDKHLLEGAPPFTYNVRQLVASDPGYFVMVTGSSTLQPSMMYRKVSCLREELCTC